MPTFGARHRTHRAGHQLPMVNGGFKVNWFSKRPDAFMPTAGAPGSRAPTAGESPTTAATSLALRCTCGSTVSPTSTSASRT